MAGLVSLVRGWLASRSLERARRLRDGELLDEATAAYRASMARAEPFGENDPRFLTPLDELARMLVRHGRHDEAAPLIERRIAIAERAVGGAHPDLADQLTGFALQYRAARQFARAEPLHRRAQAILEAALPADHPRVQQSLDALAGVTLRVGKHADAEILYQRLHEIEEQALGANDLGLASSLNRLAYVKRLLGKNQQALEIEERVALLRESAKSEG